MNDLRKIEKSVNTIVGKPITWAVYGLVLAAKCSYRGVVRFGSWLRNRYAASASKA